ncbi:MAG TPA: sigma-54 dependent transcriptional regulator [bacterium]
MIEFATQSPTVLLVDDDPSILGVLEMRLKTEGYGVHCVASGEAAVAATEGQCFDVVVTDLRMDGMDGMELLQRLHARDPGLPVIILTAHGDVGSAVQAMRLGAFDFLEKPYEGVQLLRRVRAALRGRAPGPARVEAPAAEPPFVAASGAMQRVWDQVRRLARVDSSVLITGETGTGKEVVARTLHLSSRRRQGPFRAVNCGAIPGELLESELFGHERGAFTGAHAAREGHFRAAHGGTLLLDEIGDAPLQTQVKLLRVLQDREVLPVGSSRSVEVDVRVVAATHQDLRQLVAEGRFREDLFYRIDVLPLHIPPLRERLDDIEPLALVFLAEFQEGRVGAPVDIGRDALDRLRGYSWPGNVRELRNRIEVAVALSDGGVLSPDDFSLQGATASVSEVVGGEFLPLRDARARFDRSYLISVLRAAGGNVTNAARMAGKHRTDFYGLMKRYHLKRSDFQ